MKIEAYVQLRVQVHRRGLHFEGSCHKHMHKYCTSVPKYHYSTPPPPKKKKKKKKNYKHVHQSATPDKSLCKYLLVFKFCMCTENQMAVKVISGQANAFIGILRRCYQEIIKLPMVVCYLFSQLFHSLYFDSKSISPLLV